MNYDSNGPIYSNLNGKTTDLSCYNIFTYKYINVYEEYWEVTGGTGYNPYDCPCSGSINFTPPTAPGYDGEYRVVYFTCTTT